MCSSSQQHSFARRPSIALPQLMQPQSIAEPLPKRKCVQSATEQSMQCYEIDMLIMACLLPSPCAGDNGIAVASRILNVRWRKMQGGIVHHFISILVKECTNTPLEAIALDLEDLL